MKGIQGIKRKIDSWTGPSTSTSMEGTTPELDDVNLIVYLEDTRGYKGFEHTITETK